MVLILVLKAKISNNERMVFQLSVSSHSTNARSPVDYLDLDVKLKANKASRKFHLIWQRRLREYGHLLS